MISSSSSSSSASAGWLWRRPSRKSARFRVQAAGFSSVIDRAERIEGLLAKVPGVVKAPEILRSQWKRYFCVNKKNRLICPGSLKRLKFSNSQKSVPYSAFSHILKS